MRRTLTRAKRPFILGLLSCSLLTGTSTARDTIKHFVAERRPAQVAMMVRPKSDQLSAQSLRLTQLEREVIQDYVNRHNGGPASTAKPRSLPPGLAGKGRADQLPAGWQSKCLAGTVIPSPLYDQCRPLPKDLIVKLPPPPRGTVTVSLHGKILRLHQSTRQILDSFDLRLD